MITKIVRCTPWWRLKTQAKTQEALEKFYDYIFGGIAYSNEIPAGELQIFYGSLIPIVRMIDGKSQSTQIGRDDVLAAYTSKHRDYLLGDEVTDTAVITELDAIYDVEHPEGKYHFSNQPTAQEVELYAIMRSNLKLSLDV